MAGKEKAYFWLTSMTGSLIAILFIIFGQNYLGTTTSYLLLIILITLVASLTGFISAVAILAIYVLASVAYFFTNPPFVFPLFEFILDLSLFSASGILISYLIDKYKKTDQVSALKKEIYSEKEKSKKFEKEKKHMIDEIKMRDEFLSIASHELKTPLTAMLLKIQFSLHSIRNVSLANFSVQNLLKMLENAEEQTKRLSQLINDLLNVSLITTGRFSLDKKKEDIGEIVKEVSSEFVESLAKDKREIKVDADKEVFAEVDKLRIAQVVTNLVSNAIKYGKDKQIEVRVSHANSLAEIEVKDYGIGIPNEQKEKIFNLFERGQMNGNAIKGLGVGLYISNQIVKAHGGSIKVESGPDDGTKFTVLLPS